MFISPIINLNSGKNFFNNDVTLADKTLTIKVGESVENHGLLIGRERVDIKAQNEINLYSDSGLQGRNVFLEATNINIQGDVVPDLSAESNFFEARYAESGECIMPAVLTAFNNLNIIADQLVVRYADIPKPSEQINLQVKNIVVESCTERTSWLIAYFKDTNNGIQSADKTTEIEAA